MNEERIFNEYEINKMYDLFIDKLYCLNPNANSPESLFQYILNTFIKKRKAFKDGKIERVVDLDLIIEKYGDYCRYWDEEYGSRGKYLAKDDKKVSIEQFLMKGWYDRKFITTVSNRDRYLFGDLEESFIINKIENFKKQFNEN